MRQTLTLLVAMLITAPLWAQSTRIISSDQREQLYPIERVFPTETSTISNATDPGNGTPGTITQDAVTAIKIGASSNAYSFVIGENTQLSAVQASDGDVISFIYRQNIDDCGGATIDNGLYRMSVSTDGGTNWDVGSAGTSNAASIPQGCYGIGPVNSLYTQVSRYPNMVLSLPNGGTMIADVKGVYTGAVLDPGYPTVEGWDGIVAGVINDPGNAATTVQEDYLFQNNDQFQSYSLVERVSGEYWYVGWDYNGPGAANEVGTILKANKGVYNAATGKVDWTNVLSYTMPFVRYFPTGGTDSVSARAGSPQIGFSPDGMTGYISLNADINDRDSVFLPVFFKSTDGGVSWGDPYEVKLNTYPELRDLLQDFWITVDTTTGDTLPAGSGYPTLAFDHGLSVDKNGNPHFVAIVGNASSRASDGSVGTPNYSISSGLRMFLCDITIDGFGDPNIIVITPQATFRGDFGLVGGGDSDETTADPWIQVSRTADGSKIFVSTTESDTTGNFGANDNSNPNFWTRAIDVDLMKATSVTNWTGDDATWASRAVMPKTAKVLLEDGSGNYKLPTVIMDLIPNTTLLNPVSYWYFSNISYNDADFTEDVEFFYNCKENPFTNTVSATAPGCGLSDGSITVNAAGGVGTYSYLWDDGSTMSSISGLASGIYEVTVTDSLGCTDVIEYTLNDANSPTLTVDSTANISCFGDGNGYAEVNAVPAMGATVSSYMWSNGEMSAIATMLPSGMNTLTVTDDQNCVSYITVEIDEPSDITLNAVSSNADCFGDATGSASATAFGGTGMLSYAWDNGGTTASISGLPAGTYTVTVTDMNGCDKMTAVNVAEPDTLALQLSSNGNTAQMPPFNGFATVNYTGGTDPVEFTWTGPDGFTGSSNIIFGLNGGTYVVTATDANGCTTVDSVVVDGSTGIQDELAAGISTMSIIPNPNNGVFSVSLELDRAEDVNIEVLNLNGQVVEAVRERNAVNVEHQFNLNHQASGVYMIQVTTSRGTAGRKVIVR